MVSKAVLVNNKLLDEVWPATYGTHADAHQRMRRQCKPKRLSNIVNCAASGGTFLCVTHADAHQRMHSECNLSCSQTLSTVQAVVGLLYLCLGLIAFCLTLLAHFVDSCISVLVPGRAGSWSRLPQQVTPGQEAGLPGRAALCYGPVGRALRSGYGMAGAGCGIGLGLYGAYSRARSDLHTNERTGGCSRREQWAVEQTIDSTELQHS